MYSVDLAEDERGEETKNEFTERHLIRYNMGLVLSVWIGTELIEVVP